MDVIENPTAEDEKKPFDSVENQYDDSQPDPDEHLSINQGDGSAWLIKVPKFLMERWAAQTGDDKHLATIRIYQPDANNKKPRIFLFLPPNRDPVNAPSADTVGSASAATPPMNGIPTPPASQPSSEINSQSTLNINTAQVPSRNPTPTPLPGDAQPAVGPSFTHPHITNWPYFDPAKTLPTTGNEPDIYEVEMVNPNVLNQVVVAERHKETPGSSRPPHLDRTRMTSLTGRIKHECNLRPALSATYRKQMRERHQKYNTPTRQIAWIQDAGILGGRGGINRLSSGVGVGARGAFSDLIKTKPKLAKGFERMARMPRNQLLDQLFSLFRDQPRWSIRPLRERTQQPEAYLKEVLSEIAFLHRSGEFNGFWELKANFKEDSAMKSENVPVPSGSGDVKMETFDEDDEEEDDDDDMEEIS